MKPSSTESWAKLADWAATTLGVVVTPQQLGQLRAYIDALQLWNRRIALVSQRDLQPILEKHVADSLVAAAHCGDASHIADLGSGAGFPGIPIAIMQADARVCLMESVGKKVSFLDEVHRRAQLANLSVFDGRIETAWAMPAHQGAYDLVTARALTSLENLIPLATPLLSPGGRLLAMRSAEDGVPEGSEVIWYTLPDGSPRQLVTVQLIRT